MKPNPIISNSTNYLHDIYKKLPIPSLILLPDAPRFTIADVNSAYVKLTGRTELELLGKGFFEAFSVDGSFTVVRNITSSLEKVISTGQPDKIEALNEGAVNGYLDIENLFADIEHIPVPDRDGSTAAIIHSITDVTWIALLEKQRKLKRYAPTFETGIKAGESRPISLTWEEARSKELHHLKLLESVITNTKDAILITEAEPFDQPGPRILYVNEAFTKMTGYTPEEVIGKTPRILQGPRTDKKELAKLKEAMRKWQHCEITTVNYKKSGEEYWINMALSPVADEKGWYTHWIAIERDVTERKLEELQKLLLAEISVLFSGPGGLDEILQKMVELIAQYGGFAFVEVWLTSKNNQHINLSAKILQAEDIRGFYEEGQLTNLAKGCGLPGITWQTGITQIWQDIGENRLFSRAAAAKKAGLKIGWGIPICCNGEVIGVFVLALKHGQPQPANFPVVLENLGTYAGVEIKRKQQEIELNQIVSFAPDIFSEIAVIKDLEQKSNLLESIGEPFFAVDKNWVVTYWNTQAENATRIPKKAIVGQNLWGVFTYHASLAYQKYHEAMQTGQAVIFEDYSPILDKWFDINAYPSANGLSVYFKDISERKKAEEAIRLSNERYRLVAKATSDSIWDWDITTGKITREGDGFIKLFGYENEPAVINFLSWEKLVHPDDIAYLLKGQQLAFGDQQRFFWEDEYRFLKANGLYAFVYSRGYIIRDSKGFAIRMIGSTQDITQQKEQFNEINRIKQNIDSLINTTNDLIWSVGKDLAIIEANNAFKITFNLITGNPAPEGEKVIPPNLGDELAKKWTGLYKRALAGERFNVDDTFIDPFTKRISYNEISFTPIINQHGDVTGVACFAKDITDRIKYAKAVEDQNRQLREIAWTQSHVVRAPLANMLGITNIINELNVASPECKSWLSPLAEEAKKLDSIITDIVHKSYAIGIKM
jgi:PAS domain S-box-containing protein